MVMHIYMYALQKVHSVKVHRTCQEMATITDLLETKLLAVQSLEERFNIIDHRLTHSKKVPSSRPILGNHQR